LDPGLLGRVATLSGGEHLLEFISRGHGDNCTVPAPSR
jgi:hypothetical protein